MPINKQNGVALIIFALILALVATAFLVSNLDNINVNIERDKKTAKVLAEAKAALIGHATSVNLLVAGRRPGDLPCPDNHPLGDINEGVSSTPCNLNALGRLPWKTLGVSDLRDDSGERLWYAVSSTFKNSTRTGTLNSDTNGAITVRDISGSIINDGSSSSAAIAVVIAPGSPLQRQDGLVQNRTVANYNTPSHYLDNTVSEDNSNFVDGGSNGFINGVVKNAGQQIIVNDKLITVSQSDLMPLLEKRVANEVLYCLKQYALLNSNSFDRHPWSSDLLTMPSYDDTNNKRFGHIPDTPFDDTESDSGNNMSDVWPGTCSIVSGSGWWLNWKELVFYAVADNHDPNTVPSPSLPSTACVPGVPSDCLSVTTPSGIQNNKKAVVIVAGKTLTGQSRSTTAQKQAANNYLESTNALGGLAFLQSPVSAAFNDVVVFY